MGSDSPQSNKDSDAPDKWGRTRRRIVRTPPRYATSHSDDDDRMFTPLKRNASHPQRRRTSVLRSYQPTNNHAFDGSIRRSTRQRKLKYDNYNDSWIVTSQTARGYPSYIETSRSRRGKLKLEEQDELEDDREGEEEEEEEEEETNEGGIGQRLRRQLRTSKLPLHLRALRSRRQTAPPPQPPPKQNKISEGEEEFELSSASVSGNKQSADNASQDHNYQDMYARVKQRRRAAVLRREVRDESNAGEQEEEDREDSEGREVRKTREGREPLPQAQPTAAPPASQPNKSESETSSEELSEIEERRRLRTRRSGVAATSRRTYHLRQVKPTVNRFQASEVVREVVMRGGNRRRPRHHRWSTRRPPRWSSSNSSDSSDDHDRFDRKRDKQKSNKSSKSLALAGGSGGARGKSAPTGLLADIDPVALDTSIRFSNVGGLESHIDCLKEMVVFPMLYKDIFIKFNVTPPKGVLFHGPPGTGKTLMARALANECSQGSRKVSFFMRKGADCLSKWVGESERQLRLLFDEAKQARPSIIFFDELDGLAPVRSSKQDQIHASIVCTLLALMDGLDNRGDIIVIGATNRIDSIDPALRRPGRFDRELYFPLPGVKERREILSIHTKGWGEESVLEQMAEESWGYCGSDLKALCSEAVIHALKRVFPQIYSSSKKLLLDADKVKVEKVDFMRAKQGIIPASRRGVSSLSRRLPRHLEPLISHSLLVIYNHLSRVFPHVGGPLHKERVSRNPRLVIVGEKCVTLALSSALLHKLEHCSVLSISIDAIYSDPSVTPEEAIARVMREVPQRSGCIVWLGDLAQWWGSMSDVSRSVFSSLLGSLDPTLPVLFLGISVSRDTIPRQVNQFFSDFHGEIKVVPSPTNEQKVEFFSPLFKVKALKPPLVKKQPDELEELMVAPPTPPPPLSQTEQNQLYLEEETTLRELRIFLRQICAKLARNKQFYMFSKPVDINEVPDYLNIIKEPMDLETMMTKIDLHKYTCADDFLKDVDLLCRNALEYNPDKDPEDKQIRHRACYLRDTAYALIKAEMDSDFEINCRSIRDKRAQRSAEESSGRFVREFFPDQASEPPTAPPSLPDAKPSTSPAVMNGEVESTKVKTQASSEGKKRKRRISSWSKGNLKKKKAHSMASLQRLVQEGEMDTGGGAGTGDEEAPHHSSTPIKIIKSEYPITGTGVVNGVLSGESSESWLTDDRLLNDSLAPTEISACAREHGGEEKRLLIDEKALNEVLINVINHSKNVSTYSSLIDFYVTLARTIDTYSRNWNRSEMILDLRKDVERFVSQYMNAGSCEVESVDDETENSNSESVSREASNPSGTVAQGMIQHIIIGDIG